LQCAAQWRHPETQTATIPGLKGELPKIPFAVSFANTWNLAIASHKMRRAAAHKLVILGRQVGSH